MFNRHGEKYISVETLIELLQQLEPGKFVRCNVSHDLAIHEDADGTYLGYVSIGNEKIQFTHFEQCGLPEEVL